MRKKPKPGHNVLDLCNRASDLLKSIGFERAYVSMKSEAVYFQYPGRHGFLRVSMHRHHRGMIGQDNVVATLTFRGNAHDAASTLRCSPDKIETMIHIAIGQYMVRSTEPKPSRYRGKRGTWEDGQIGELRG